MSGKQIKWYNYKALAPLDPAKWNEIVNIFYAPHRKSREIWQAAWASWNLIVCNYKATNAPGLYSLNEIVLPSANAATKHGKETN